MSINIKAKDTMFTLLFRDKNNVFELYKELHPEDIKVTVDDIKIETLNNIITRDFYNDLGFIVGNRLIILVEEQSTCNPNMTLRMLIYLSRTYENYIEEYKLNIYSSSVLALPKPELYIIYTGENNTDELSFNRTYFDNKSCIDINVKIINNSNYNKNQHLIYQYLQFCNVFNKHYKNYSIWRKTAALYGIYTDYLNEIKIQEFISKVYDECIFNKYLKDLLISNKTGVLAMCKLIFNKTYAFHMQNENIRNESDTERNQYWFNEGASEEKIKIATNMLKLNVQDDIILKATELSIDEIDILKSVVQSIPKVENKTDEAGEIDNVR